MDALDIIRKHAGEADIDFLRETLQVVLHAVMDAGVSQHLAESIARERSLEVARAAAHNVRDQRLRLRDFDADDALVEEPANRLKVRYLGHAERVARGGGGW